ncbi:hypothetical protein MMC29_002547 [Sticta canariensis]|nr:hypothetical protein [Sticta canariensis]
MIAKGDDRTIANPCHIFRALLRQCTYLPDSSARCFFRNYVVMRFRKHNPRPRIPSKPTLYPPKIQKALLNRARKGLTLLERANNGYRSPLLKVLEMTYGHRGRRRRELLQRLMQDAPPREEILKRLVPSITAQASGEIFGSQLEAFLNAQRRSEVGTSSVGLRKLSLAGPKIPSTNSWDRPMPLKRVQNMKEKWYADLLEQIMPPLPQEEWERLRALAIGIKWEELVPRRKRAGMTENETDHNPDAELSLSGIVESSKRVEISGSMTNPHRLTPRFRRRLWASVFAERSYMTWHVVEKKWIVQWGTQQTMNAVVDRPSLPLELSLFEGVDEQGKIISTQ